MLQGRDDETEKTMDSDPRVPAGPHGLRAHGHGDGGLPLPRIPRRAWGMNELALFAGAGGGILGGKLLGWKTKENTTQ